MDFLNNHWKNTKMAVAVSENGPLPWVYILTGEWKWTKCNVFQICPVLHVWIWHMQCAQFGWWVTQLPLVLVMDDESSSVTATSHVQWVIYNFDHLSFQCYKDIMSHLHALLWLKRGNKSWYFVWTSVTMNKGSMLWLFGKVL